MSSDDKRYYDDLGFVLKRRNVGETDRILTIMTKEHGKLSVRAKGVRNARSKLAGSLEPFSEVALHITHGRSLDLIIGARLTRLHDLPQRGLEVVTAGFILNEMIDALVPERVVHTHVYDILHESMTALSQGVHPLITVHYFSFCVLQDLGYMPQLPKIDESVWYFNIKEGIFRKNKEGIYDEMLPQNVLKLWKLCELSRLDTIGRVANVLEIAEEGQVVLERFYAYQFDKAIDSKKLD